MTYLNHHSIDEDRGLVANAVLVAAVTIIFGLPLALIAAAAG